MHFVQVTVTVKEETAEAQALKEMMLRLAPAAVRSKLEEYLRALREGTYSLLALNNALFYEESNMTKSCPYNMLIFVTHSMCEMPFCLHLSQVLAMTSCMQSAHRA